MTAADTAHRSDSGAGAREEHFRRLELIVQNTTNMVVVTNRWREIEWVNPAYTQVTGWTLDEVRGRNPRNFLHGPRTSLSAASRLGGLLRTGQAVKDFEMLNYKKSGEPYWVSLSIQPICGDGGEVSEYVAIQSDVTERKQRELETARLLRRLREAQRIAKLGHMEHDLSTGTVHCSGEIFRILDSGHDEGDASYESLMDCTHPEDVTLVRQRYEQAVNEGGIYESEHRVLSRTGRVKWVHLRGVLEGWDDGTPALCRLAVQDITERKQAEQLAREKELLEQASRSQHDVLLRISHELRTPLHAVHGFAEMVERLESARLSERSKTHLRHIRDSARHLLAIVNDILELTGLQGRHATLQSRPVELGSVVRHVATLLEPVAAERKIHIEVAGPPTPVAALADRQRLVQVLINLIGNAIKYNRAGGHVTVRPMRLDEQQVAVAVQDSGVGIAPEHLGRLFEPFYRVDAASAPSPESSGLGLAIARTLALAMGGDIQVESSVGQGSTFLLTLPLSPLAEVPVAPAERPATESGATPGGVVLYIEDNEVNCVLVETYLQQRPGVTLHCRHTGAEGLEAARLLRPHLVLIDMHLTDMNGHQLLRRLLDEPELQRIPCVAFSADVRETEVEAAIRSGFREYLCKPLGAAEFLTTVDRLLGEEPLVTRF